ncbi:hypothetical protein BJ875DRAFT_282160 [Amylocarpus encephaloides]|uniref:Uncharacterized protein n=1 Tax=Amylocarpus encephaloides TaxID=45428 RepID=A0A9P7YJQ0_9HELO|nr:hypothetical protein BJ875DRAFT_282160 [Amylocarpus encephaloides]
MNQLPVEILGLILKWDVVLARLDKNSILPLRLVCKAFDQSLRPYIMRTIKLEYSCFLKNSKINVAGLEKVGNLCDSVYLDMMVVRDEEEITRLTEIFHGLIAKVPEMVPTLASLRRYCMNETTFDETDFRRVLEDTLDILPNLRRFKMILPYQVVGTQGSPSTILLAITLACLAVRSDEHCIETLVIDHVSDTTINNITMNPSDLRNAISVFRKLKHLVLWVKRQECRSQNFNRNLWLLIHCAPFLTSLCLIGWNVKRDIEVRRHHHPIDLPEWRMRSLPYPIPNSKIFDHLKFLELKRIDIDPHELICLIRDCSSQLKELYLVEVYIKVNGGSDGANVSLWIGHPNVEQPQLACWVAHSLRQMITLNLDILRVTGLGYDDFEPDHASIHPDYDLKDPTGQDKSFDQRFVEAVMHPEIRVIVPSPAMVEALEHDHILPTFPLVTQGEIDATPPVEDDLEEILAAAPQYRPETSESTEQSDSAALKPADYDADTFQLYHNTTSKYIRSIDNNFFNHKEHALRELQNLINVAERGMQLINDEIEMYRQASVHDGQLATLPPIGLAPELP